MNCAEHKNEALANCPSCLAEYWKAQYTQVKAERDAAYKIADHYRAERDTYKQALDDIGVTPAEAKAGVARSKAIHAERDALKSALEKASEQIRKCDYTPARSTLLEALKGLK